MKQRVGVLLLCAAASITSPAIAGPETILSCAEGNQAATHWSVPGAATVCHQTVSGVGIDAGRLDTDTEQAAAFRNNVLVAVRKPGMANGDGARIDAFQPGDWRETGSTGVPGELWWGRTADRHVFLGQESHVRLMKTDAVPPSDLPAMQDFLMRRMMASLQKRPMAYKAGDERFMLFQKPRIVYLEHAATTVDFDGGLGGSAIPSSKVTNARLELQTRPVVKGVLRFELLVDGRARSFAVPLLADEEPARPRARVSGDDHAPACEGTDNPVAYRGKNACIVPDGVTIGTGDTSREFYDATGAFFGDHAGWAVIRFKVTVNSPSRNRSGAAGRGLIILKAQ